MTKNGSEASVRGKETNRIIRTVGLSEFLPRLKLWDRSSPGREKIIPKGVFI